MVTLTNTPSTRPRTVISNALQEEEEEEDLEKASRVRANTL